jgi:CheY-like chemotaxis protein
MEEKTKTILIVEDDELFRKSLVTFIGALGYRIVAVESAETALEKLATMPFDLLFSDIHLGGMNGVELARLARGHQKNIPVVLISGFLTEKAQLEAAEAQVDAILRKPADLVKVAGTLSSLL